ncbi:MAG: hypothetical protein AAF587_27750 [Bacteroidota bacterium]
MSKSIFSHLLSLTFLVLALIGTTNSVKAQYKTAIGLRLGSPLSISLKHFLREPLALEVYVGTRGYTSSLRTANVSAALQFHKPLELIDELDGLHYYLGVGASAFFWSYGGLFDGINFSDNSIGIQGYAGLDYAFASTPINLSLDWSPTIFLNTDYVRGFGLGYGSLSIRYIFKSK